MKSNLDKLREKIIKLDKEQKNYVRLSWFNKTVEAILKDVEKMESYVYCNICRNEMIGTKELKQLLKGGVK